MGDVYVKALENALINNPAYEAGWRELCRAYSGDEQSVELESICKKIVLANPENEQAWFNYGFALERLERNEEALECYQRANELVPDRSDTLNRMGMLFSKLERADEGLAAFSASLKCGANSAVAHYGYAITVRLKGLLSECEHHCRVALEMAPDNVAVYVQLGKVLSDQGKLDEALEVFSRAESIDPGNLDMAVGVSEVYERKGARDHAYETIRPFLLKEAPHADVLCIFAKISSYLGRENEAAGLIEKALSEQDLSGMQKVALHFRAGEIYDALDEFDSAIKHFNLANSLKNVSYSKKVHHRFISELISIFSRTEVENFTRGGECKKRLVFIVGMPRSGTSLVEQMLSVHYDVYGAGELSGMNEAAYKIGLSSDSEDMSTSVLNNLQSDKVAFLAAEYAGKVNELSGDKGVVTDKMPTNYRWLGLIQLLFPEARIIHMRRNPLDTCLSCYMKDFLGVHEYAYGLEDLGSYYREYVRLMEYWRETLTIPILDIDYEDLVMHTEEEIRKVLEFCDLEWDRQVLAFNNSDRIVATASYDQVRKPVYRTSVGRWKSYEPYLHRLVSSLDGELKD